MKKVFLVLVMLGLLVSCSSGITQYATVYLANNITVSGDKSCNKLKLLFRGYKIAVYKYNNKYIAGFSLIAKKSFTTAALVSLSGNNLFIWLKDRTMINDSGLDIRATFNTNFNMTTHTLPNTIGVSWDTYYNGNPFCHYEVTATKVDSATQVYTKNNYREVYESLKSAFETNNPGYIVKK